MDIYLGKHPKHQDLAAKLFGRVRAPLLRVLFARADPALRIATMSRRVSHR